MLINKNCASDQIVIYQPFIYRRILATVGKVSA